MELAAFEKANGPLIVHLDEVLKKNWISRDKLTMENHSMVTMYTLAAR